jgi:dipeptidyl-peptidase 4
VTPVAAEPLPLFYRSPLFGEVVWTPDGAAVLAVALDRSHRRGELRRIDPATGACEVVLVEASQTWVSFAGTFDARPDVRLLADGRVLFWSERTGWGHLWLQEADGAQRPVTTGEWVVRELVAVDEAAGTAVVLGTGREPGGDPYLAQPYRVDLATGAVTRLCDEPADRLLHHHVVAAPSGRWLVDVASAVDVPTTSVLRDADGAVVMALSRCDPGPLAAVGWQPPERVRIPGVAGEDDLWGAIHLPPDFDPAQRYPVVEEVYAAPQMAVAPIAFPGAPGWLAGSTAPSIAALGFVVVVIDGRATPGRSRAFGTAGHGRPEGLPLEDHPAAIRHLAATRPWMDLDRVGVTGHSGGGYASTRLLLQQPDLYRAAVSTAGNHDETIYHAGWSDRFFGDVDHAARANARLADRLRGRLLLIHGELDDNVSPHQTLRLVDACMAADVDVDLLLVPGGDHMLNTHIAHWTRRRLDFLVAHVMGATPPAVRFAPIEPSLGGLAGLFA